MPGVIFIRAVVLAGFFAGALPAAAAPNIESLADELAVPAAAPASGCTEKLPDGSFADCPTGRQMVVPGMGGSRPAAQRGSIARARPIRRDISMTFLVGSAELTSGAKAMLDRFADRLVQVASYKPFAVEGHTDRSGPADVNRKLSQARAESVVTYLAGKGVDAGRMTPRGLGFDKPLAGVSPDSPRNRRVEVVAN